MANSDSESASSSEDDTGAVRESRSARRKGTKSYKGVGNVADTRKQARRDKQDEVALPAIKARKTSGGPHVQSISTAASVSSLSQGVTFLLIVE